MAQGPADTSMMEPMMFGAGRVSGDQVASRPADPEAEEVRRAKARDGATWSAWYDRYHPSLYRYAYARLGRQAEAEDIAAQVFVEALKGIDSFSYRGRPVLAWLYRIARNLVVDQIRRNVRHQNAWDRLVAPSEPDPGAAPAVEALALREAMNHLTGEQREVLILRYFLSLSTREVAALLGKNEVAVFSLQARALAALRRRLSSEERS